jgi:hypothetical protein
MVRKRARNVALVLAMAVTGFPALSQAAGGGGDGVMPIRFARGDTCWQYSGRAFMFRGRFLGGQTLVVTAAGRADFSDGRHNWSRQEPRDVSIEAHGSGRSIDGQDGEFYIPATGTYDISLWPHAIQGAPGTIRICTR